MRAALSALLSGALFAAGLVISGMTRPAKVVGFLDFTGSWDPSLALVMGGALLVHGLLQRAITRRPAPLLDRRFYLPTRREIDARLLGGAVLFGVGWGLAGYCPGPGLVSMTSGLRPFVFVAAMVAGMYIHKLIDALITRRSAP